jgi:hypothetical protein
MVGEAPAEAPASPAPGGVPSTSTTSPGACADTLGVAPLRRLTRAEYDATVRDLVGVDARAAVGFVPDEKLGAFDVNVTSPVSQLALDDYLKAADGIARQVVSNAKALAALLPCDARAGDAACARGFIETVGARAYRRLLSAEEIARLQKVFDAGAADGGFTSGVRLALQAMLSSPGFVYHLEMGAPDASGPLRVLTAYELASRLSYFIWGSMPDAALFEAARSGELARPEGFAAQARRLLKDDRAREAMRSFHAQWLGVTKLLDRDQFDDPIGPSAYQEVVRVVDDVLWSGDGKLTGLLTTRASFADAGLWSLYGLPGAAPATGVFAKVQLDPRQRSGVLTRVAALAAHRTPTARGKFVRVDVLCQDVPPPPANVDTTLPAPDPGQPPRARWEKHVENPVCGSCHRLMDPVGFGFSSYDELGKYRTMDGKWPVDARGEIVGTLASDGPFDGPIELSERLAKSAELGSCVAREMFVYALGRLADPARDRCALEAADRAFRESGYDVRALILAVAASDGFRARRLAP